MGMVIVFGSLNMDLVTRTPRLPKAGETLIGSQFYTTSGGKGANQAVAVAKLGVPTEMIGRVGGDNFGADLLEALRSVGVGTQQIQVDQDIHSGVAVITVTETGENQIIGVPGANGRLNADDVTHLEKLLPQADALMLQLEVPLPVVKAAAQMARNYGVQVILDPAPVPSEPLTDLYPLVDLLLPNEVEAGQLVGFTVHNVETATQAAKTFQEQGVKTVIVKLGAQGAVCVTPEERFLISPFAIAAIDTVAAGDAFAGGLVTALVEGLPLRQATAWAAAAGALTTTRVGAQSAMPDRVELEAFLAGR